MANGKAVKASSHFTVHPSVDSFQVYKFPPGYNGYIVDLFFKNGDVERLSVQFVDGLKKEPDPEYISEWMSKKVKERGEH